MITSIRNTERMNHMAEIVFENLSKRFTTKDGTVEALKNINLSIEKGDIYGIIGMSGAGKSTLVRCINLLERPTEGKVYVEGEELTAMSPKELRQRRKKIGMIFQQFNLFSTKTVAQNIAYGKPDASLDEVVAAAKAAHADSFIRRLPEGYDTVIAEDGGNISQGQKQLLCIARVMLCLPPMLILDEATSSIDTRTEVRIQAAFARMMQGRTSFIVAHRLSTIREADVILVMKDGHIVEQGDHDTLLAQGGFYAKLYNSQFEGVET